MKPRRYKTVGYTRKAWQRRLQHIISLIREVKTYKALAEWGANQ